MTGTLFKWLLLPFLFVSFQLAGEEMNVGILVKGPEKKIGFPLIYPNALLSWTGNYRYLESMVLIYFTRETILRPPEWNKLTCGKTNGFSPGKASFFYADKDWSVLFQFTAAAETLKPPGSAGAPLAGALPGDQCAFIDKFLVRLKYFLRDGALDGAPLFPAILEFP